MNKKVLCCMIVLCVGCLLFGRNMIAKETEKTINETETEQAEPLIITTPTASHNGTVSVYESDGSMCFQYVGGNIEVVNDGGNGEDINIEVHKMGEPDSCGSDSELPTHIMLYDHTNHKIISYVGFPRIEDGVLIIDDAVVSYEEETDEGNN